MTRELLSGQLSIVRTQNAADNTKPIRIRLVDGSSRTYIAEIHMALEEFAEALTGLSDCDCDYVFYGGKYAGATLETKQEKVYGEADWGYLDKDKDAKATALVAPLMVDGWSPRLGDIGNHHCRGTDTGGVFWNVVFSRFVGKDGQPIID